MMEPERFLVQWSDVTQLYGYFRPEIVKIILWFCFLFSKCYRWPSSAQIFQLLVLLIFSPYLNSLLCNKWKKNTLDCSSLAIWTYTMIKFQIKSLLKICNWHTWCIGLSLWSDLMVSLSSIAKKYLLCSVTTEDNHLQIQMVLILLWINSLCDYGSLPSPQSG